MEQLFTDAQQWVLIAFAIGYVLGMVTMKTEDVYLKLDFKRFW